MADRRSKGCPITADTDPFAHPVVERAPDAGTSLEGKVAVITGAASGQGRAAAILFAEHGARVVVADLDDDGSAATVADIAAVGGEAVALHADISTRAANEEMVALAVQRFGRLDVLYNNAAIQMSGRLLEATPEEWELTLRTNLTSIFWACRAGIPAMLEGPDDQRGGSIINTSSVLGLVGSEGYAAYGPAKAGLLALTRQIACEFGPHIRANVIAPGSIDTPRFRKVAAESGDPAGFVDVVATHIPVSRLGTAADVARVALFLASDASAYTSGAVIPVDGGLAVLR